MEDAIDFFKKKFQIPSILPKFEKQDGHWNFVIPENSRFNIMNDVKVERITAPNGSVFGADTVYLVGENDISIVDPGPNIKSHHDKIIKVGKNGKDIRVTHTHRDPLHIDKIFS